MSYPKYRYSNKTKSFYKIISKQLMLHAYADSDQTCAGLVTGEHEPFIFWIEEHAFPIEPDIFDKAYNECMTRLKELNDGSNDTLP